VLPFVKSCVLTLEDAPFDPLWFAQAHIAMPASIARSVPKRQAEFFFGRWAAREALVQCGVAGFDVGIGTSREPVWPPGVVGSLTHCHGYAAAAVARARDLQCLGIDIERVVPSQSLDALLTVALDATELKHLAQSAPGLTTAQRATLAFSAKESFYKAAFPQVGRFFGFEAARVVEVRERPGVLRLALTESLASEWRAGCTIDVSFQWLTDDVVFTSFCE
jgi:4'-phosphopantetheinyl transferase EntD